MTRASPRYRVSGEGRWATLRLADGTETHYWAPSSGGYVWDVTDSPGTSGRQVMDATVDGSTLRWSGRGRLADLIRREMRVISRYADREGLDFADMTP